MEEREINSRVVDLKDYKNSYKNELKEYKFIREKEREVATDLDENNYLEKYIDKLESDRRSQEERLSNNMQLMEQRITEERRLSEERMENRFNQVMNSVEKTNEKIDSKISNMESKLDNTYKWIVGTCVATILGIAGLIITVMLTK